MIKHSLLFFLFTPLGFFNSLVAQTVSITSLPITITAPGTYVLASDMSSVFTVPAAIEISSSVSGSVIVDLGGHTITGPSAAFGAYNMVGIDIGYGGTSVNTSPITIQNGTITNFMWGVQGINGNGGNGIYSPLTNITVSNITVNFPTPVLYNGSYGAADNGGGVNFYLVGHSVIQTCTFNGNWFDGQTNESGINDTLSPGGNLYSHCVSQNAVLYPLQVTQSVTTTPPVPLVLTSCTFN